MKLNTLIAKIIIVIMPVFPTNAFGGKLVIPLVCIEKTLQAMEEYMTADELMYYSCDCEKLKSDSEDLRKFYLQNQELILEQTRIAGSQYERDELLREPELSAKQYEDAARTKAQAESRINLAKKVQKKVHNVTSFTCPSYWRY